jgi:hypothetical protein
VVDDALVRKLKLKGRRHAAVINAPDGYVESLRPPPAGVELAESADLAGASDGAFDWVQMFARDRAELVRLLPDVRRALAPEGQLWISYPKGSSKIQTDLTRDQGWGALEDADLMWINLISVDTTWSAFGLRPYRPGEARQTFR